ncbi:hypothetical protein V8C86DRAFT_1239878 [Haematococcus lacustris]
MQVLRSSAAPTRLHNHPLIFSAPHPRVLPSHLRTRHLSGRCRLRVVSGLFGNATAQQPAPAASEGSGAWYRRGADLWVSVHSVAEFEQEVLKADKLVCVDWYAPWCASCQRSYPEVCNVISCNPDLRSAFKFVKVCIDDLPKSFSRQEGVSALPRLSVYSPGQGRVLVLDIPFSKVKHLRKNLEVVAANPDSTLTLDPNVPGQPWRCVWVWRAAGQTVP